MTKLKQLLTQSKKYQKGTKFKIKNFNGDFILQIKNIFLIS